MARSPWRTFGPIVGLGIVGLAVVFGFVGCYRPAQMGADPAVFRTVDALYTAVTMRDANLVSRCQQELEGLRREGRLPASAAEDLESVVAMTRRDQWERAAGRLHDFMLAQRREGAEAPPPAKSKKTAPRR